MLHDALKVDFKGWCQIKCASDSAAIFCTFLLYANHAKLAKLTNACRRSSKATSAKCLSTANQPLLVWLPLRPFPGLINSFGSWPLLCQPLLTFNVDSGEYAE